MANSWRTLKLVTRNQVCGVALSHLAEFTGSLIMPLRIITVVIGYILLTQTALADVVPIGTLQCDIQAGPGVLLGAYRNISCIYKRSNSPIEQYEGFTGVITTDTAGPQAVTFEVFTPEPAALAALAGDYDQNLVGSPGMIQPAGNNLLGGRRRRIVLKAVDNNATTNLALLGYAIGVTPLHLDYAGVLPRHASNLALRRGQAEAR